MDMQLLIIGFILFVIGVVCIAIVVERKEDKQRKTLLENVARKRNGTIVRRWLSQQLEYPYKDLTVTIQSNFYNEYSPPQTMISASVYMKTHQEIRISRTFILWFHKKNQVNGNREFMETFKIRGGDPSLAHQLLSSDVQKCLLELEKHRPTVHLKKNRFSIIMFSIPKTEEDYEQRIHTFELCINRLKTLEMIE